MALDSLILFPVVLIAEDVLMAMFSFSSYAVGFILGMSYFSLMTSSKWQATLGKKAFGIIVTDKNGKRLSYQKAINRYAASVLSGLLLLIGYLVQPFTARKQTLHDILCGALVVKGGQAASAQIKLLIWTAAFFGLMVFIAAAFFSPVADNQTAVSPIQQEPIRPGSEAASPPDSEAASPPDSEVASSPGSEVASPQSQRPPIPPSNTDPRLEAARQRCRQNWPANLVMLNYCIEEQEAYYWKHMDPASSSSAAPELEAARQRCRQQWPTNFVMLNRCIEEQEEAYRKRR